MWRHRRYLALPPGSNAYNVGCGISTKGRTLRRSFSFLAPLVGEAAGFLHFLRTLRLPRSYQLLACLRADFDTFRPHDDLIIACANFSVFPFVTTGFI